MAQISWTDEAARWLEDIFEYIAAQVQDGKIIHWTDYYDGLTFLRQLGVVSFPSSPREQ